MLYEYIYFKNLYFRNVSEFRFLELSIYYNKRKTTVMDYMDHTNKNILKERKYMVYNQKRRKDYWRIFNH